MDRVNELKQSLQAGGREEQQTFSNQKMYDKAMDSHAKIGSLSHPKRRKYTMFVDETGCTGTKLGQDSAKGSDWLLTYGLIAENSKLDAMRGELRKLAAHWGISEIKGSGLHGLSSKTLRQRLKSLEVPLRQGFQSGYAYASNKIGLYLEKVLVHQKLHPDKGLDHHDLSQELDELEKAGKLLVSHSAGFMTNAFLGFLAEREAWGTIVWDAMNSYALNEAIREGFTQAMGMPTLNGEPVIEFQMSKSVDEPGIWAADMCAYQTSRRLQDAGFKWNLYAEFLPSLVIGKHGKWVAVADESGDVGQFNLRTGNRDVTNPW